VRLHLPGFIPGLPEAILSVVGGVPVNSEAPMVTSAQSFRGAQRGRVCVRAFIEVSIRSCL
jgi:hypothetical protein